MMTAVDPLSSTWIPEDDLLLKNAVEAGASLEALAKGAVPFSRRFTYRELRDRWHSLLFDPDISAQASDSMLKLERSGSNPSSKFNRLEHSKGNEKVLEKRKIGSIRREYYAMRKKIRSELFNASDLEFFGEPNLIDCGEHGGDFQGHLALDNEPHDGNHILSDCISNDLGLQETDFEILRHAFPETMMDISPTTAVDNNGNAFNTECQNSVEDNHPNRSLYQFPEDVSPLLINDGRESYEPNIEHKSASHMLEDNSSNFGGEEIGTSQALPTQKMFETDDSQAKPLSAFDPVDDNHQNLCSGFGGKQHFNSPDSDVCTSFHSLGFSSPLPRMPLWKTMEDLSAPAMPVSVNNVQCEEENSALPDKGDGNRKSPPGYDVVHSGSPLTDRDNGAGFINSTAISDAEFADLSDSLLNFSNEEELLLMDIDGKDAMAKSCYENLNSLLLSSPNDVQDGDLCNVEPRTSNVSKVSIATPSGPCLTDSEDIGSTVHGEQQSVCHSEVNVPLVSVLNSDSLEISDGAIFCTLNTEDQEIPCNDDIFLLIHPVTSFAASASQPVMMDSIEQLSSSADEKDCEQRLNLMKKGKEPAQSFKWSQMVGPSMLPESVPGHPIIGGAVKSEFADTKCLSLLPGEAKKALRDPTQCRSLITTADGLLEEDVTKVEFRGLDTPATSREMPSRVESGSTKMGLLESMVKPSTSDHDEPESDNEVPYYSDIEAMILEMDLGQYDQESDVSRQVARYQHGDSKRRIIRLEQCARSSLQRAMTFHGAIAMLYGRHLKHYIRKREVVLGRSTEDIDVDIDLRKEGRANKISRRQATIKMEEDGSFFLKNLGKNSISVNGKAVATGQLLRLSPSCLIEIRGMSFGFEINDKYMSRRVDNSTEKRREEKSWEYDWRHPMDCWTMFTSQEGTIGAIPRSTRIDGWHLMSDEDGRT